MISVVIPAHNVGHVVGEQLAALCEQDYRTPWETLVIDNRSSDNTVSVSRGFVDRLDMRIISAPDHASAAYARNTGVHAALGNLIVFLDGDDVAHPGLLSAYARHAEEFRIMGGQLDDSALNDPTVAAWRYSLTDGRLPVALGRFPYILTSNAAVSRDVFDEVGFFDESLRYFGEDVDFSVRAQLAGIELGWIPDAVVYYRHRDSLRSLVRQKFVYGRGSIVLDRRYSSVASPAPRFRILLSLGSRLVRGVPNLVRGRRRRGQWLAFASFLAGRLIQSVSRS